MPPLTIVLPVRNGENYLLESIESVLCQSFEDFELHVHDDSSTDRTQEILRSLGDPRLRIFRNSQPMGLFATLNKAFEGSKTELVRIWAHDDRMLQSSLQRFIDFMDEHPTAGMAYCDFHVIDDRGNRLPYPAVYREQRERTPTLAGAAVSALLFFYYGCLPGNISTVLLRRSIWESTGGFWSVAQQSPDYEMWIKASAVAPVGYLPEKLIDLRTHQLQLSFAGQKEMTIIDQEKVIVSLLRRRLATILSDDEFERHWAAHRGRQHIHWIVRAALRGDLAAARRGLHSLSDYRSKYRQAAWWLYTANGRWGVPSIADAVDKKLAMCIALDAAKSS
jgi:glycosyltransferase involved in cell wall biosynthesis